ncbi:hypothetical protein DVH05_000193 [Phytophthora capsici]|nr:hypothetical protein DVH05_000193 [Phytophthora capsici]
MVTAGLLNALEAELANQVEESRRPPFETVDAVADHVDISEPKPSDSSALRMCVGRIIDQPKLVRLELIDGSEAGNVDKIMSTLEKLDTQRRSKFVFSLTAWKPKYRSIYDNPHYFQVGGVYLFPKVHGVRRYYNLLQGSTQLNADTPPERVYPADDQVLDGENHDGASGVVNCTETQSAAACRGEIENLRERMGLDSPPTPHRGLLRRRDGETEPGGGNHGVSTADCSSELNPSPPKRIRASSRSSAK